MAAERGSMTVSAAARLGGLARQAKLTAAERTAVGKKCGAATLAKYGREHYAEIGRVGGKAPAAKPEE